MESVRKEATTLRLLRVILQLAATGALMPGVASAVTAAGVLQSQSGAIVQLAVGASAQTGDPQRLAGHTLALTHAAGASAPPPSTLYLTLTLHRDDETGFQDYLREVYDPQSPNFHHYLSQAQIAERFGPSRQAYDEVADYLRAQNLGTVERSANRLTLTIGGTRSDAERAFGVHVGSYMIGTRAFYANDRDPALPPALAAHVQAISGLSNLAQPRALNQKLPPVNFQCPTDIAPEACNLYGTACELFSATKSTGEFLQAVGGAGAGARDLTLAFNSYAQNLQLYFEECLHGIFSNPPIHPGAASALNGPLTGVPWLNVDGSNQTIGLVEFDNFQTYDIVNYLNLTGAPPAEINNLSVVNLGAGANFGAAEDEVVLDIDTVMTFASNAKVVVYSSGFPGAGSSFQNVFNRMLSDGLVTIISNSWAYCEDQTSLADVQSIDSILQSAAVSGISVFSGSGDSGGTCLDGASNTIAVPADAPHITAVGGTTLNAGAGGVYKGETWWDGSTHTPPSGQGGFGVSRFFALPSYQTGHTAATMRSVPDITAAADPANGLLICQTDAGGCPTGSLYGGTSMTAPLWAAFTALLNQAHGSNLGFINPQVYPLSATSAFHNAASMGSDFAHVGLGSPNLDALSLHLNGQSAGTPNLDTSSVIPTVSPSVQYGGSGVPADGLGAGVVVVTLRDANGNTVSGKSVTLTADVGNHATITPVSGISSVNDGTVSYTVTDQTTEILTFTAKDTTDNVTLSQHPFLPFVAAPAVFASISASPPTQVSDGVSTSSVTVTLEDALHRPSAGKQVLLTQQHNSVILGSNPGLSDAGGHAQFSVADQTQEIEAYTATDQSDGNLPVPGLANVTFTGASAACATGPAPTAGPGYRMDVYASAFPVQNGITYGGVSISGCIGVAGLAFDGAGNLFASDFNGDVYKFPPGGGVAGAGNKLATNVGLGLGALTYGNDGNLYGVRFATTGDYTTGAALKINQTTGASTLVASGLPCPLNLATDPLSGDLFVPSACSTAGATIVRIANPGGVSPSKSNYADSSGSPNGSVNFAPDGTLYVVYNYPASAGIDEIAGTNQPQPPSVTPTGLYSTYSAVATGSNLDGGAQALISSVFNIGGYAKSVAAFDMTASPPTYSGATLVTSDIGGIKVLDAQGCLYLTDANVVYRVSNGDGSCPLAGLAPDPSAVLVPETEPAHAAQGTPERFDLTFPHSTVPPGTPVTFSVTGANRLQGLALVGLNQRALFIYAGLIQGNDTITAYATIDGTLIASNPVQFVWDPSKHATAIGLNTSVTSASLGSSVTVSATIVDQSQIPVVPINDVTIQFTMGGQTCSALSNASGFANCSLTVSALSQCTLTAAFAGDATYLASTSSVLFSVSQYDVVFANGFEPRLFGGGCVQY